MRALLLAAGLGTRLRPLTDTVPKCLVEINGRPLLDHWLELLSNGSVHDVLINLHYLPEPVCTYLAGMRYPLNVTAVIEDKLLGTAGTLLRNRAFFATEPIMLIHADNLSVFNMSAFIERYSTRKSNIEITMMTFITESPELCGVVELNAEGEVFAFHEKTQSSPSRLANAAIYIISPMVIDFVQSLEREFVDFSTEVIPHFMGRINTYHNDIYHRDIGTPESLRLAQNEYPLVISKLNNECDKIVE